MSLRQRSSRVFVSRFALIAIIGGMLLSFAGAATNAANFSLVDSVRNFFGYRTAAPNSEAPNTVEPRFANPTSAVFINEILYDITGADAGEFVEVAAPAGTNMANYSIVLYNGSGGSVYDTDALAGTTTDQGSGYGTASISYPSNGIQDGPPDGIALINTSTNTLVQFLCYEGTFVGVGGLANGVTCTDIGVSQPGTNAAGTSLQLHGSGTTYGDFTWNATSIVHTQDAVNTGQTFTGGHTFTSTKANNDEITIAAIEVRNSTNVVDFSWIERLTSPSLSADVTTTRDAVLIALWFGDGGIGTVHSATPNNGFTKIEELTLDASIVQLSVATKSVGPGTHNVTWTSASGEGAQLWLIAIEDTVNSETPVLGVHRLDYVEDGNGGTSITTRGIATDNSQGSVLIVTTGRGVLNASQVFSDSENHTWVQVGTAHTYTNYPTSGTEVWKAISSNVSVSPDTSITANPPNPSNDSTPTFSFTGTTTQPRVIAGFECKVDADAFAACTSPHTTASLADGLHTFQVRAVDNFGTRDPTPASHMWTVDTVAPVLTYTPIPNTTSTMNPTLPVTITDAVGVTGATIFWRIDGGVGPIGAFSSSACMLSSGNAQNGVWNCTIGGMLTNPSPIAYYVTAQDAAMNTGSNPGAGAMAPNLFTIGAAVVPAGTYTNLSLSYGSTIGGGMALLGGGNVMVVNVLTLGGIVSTGANTLTLGCAATVTGAGGGNYVVGTVNKEYCGTGTFVYPVGTMPDNLSPNGVGNPPEYTPVTVNVTSGEFPSYLSVRAFDGTLIGFDPANSLSRNWELEELGDITADLSFTYLDGAITDINGTEANYIVYRRNSNGTTDPMCLIACVDTINNILGPVTGVTQFSRWSGAALVPTAAGVDVAGRVLVPGGGGLRNAIVTLTDSRGVTRTSRSSSFGNYRFEDVRVGETYILAVNSKRYVFTPRTIQVLDEVTGLDITADGEQ